MKYQRTRPYKCTSVVVAIAFLWTMTVSPALAQIRVRVESESDIGAANGIAVNSGVVAYLSGKYVKYSDGVQQFGKVRLDGKGTKIIQPSVTRTYVVDENGKFYIIDTTNFNNPTILGRYLLPDYPATVCTDLDEHDADTIVVMNDNMELARVDVSDPANPTCTSQQNMGTGFESRGSQAVVLYEGALFNLDISGSPWLRGATGPGTDIREISMDVAGDKVYAAKDDDVRAYDITGAMPTFIPQSQYHVSGTVLDMTVSATADKVWVATDSFGSLVFALITHGIGGFVETALAFTGDTHGIKSRMATDPTDPSVLAVAQVYQSVVYTLVGPTLEVAHTFIAAEYMHKMTIATILGNPHLFAATGLSGFHGFDISNPLAPLFLLALTTIYAAWCLVFGPLPAVSAADGAPAGLVGPFGYAALDALGFQAYDFADPTSPIGTDAIFTGGVARDVAVSGNFAYMADDLPGLQVINITDPNNLSIATTVFTTGPAMRVAVVGGHAYVAADFAGVRVIDISTPATASEVGSLPGLTGVTHIASDGIYLYFGQGNTVQIYDLVSPTAPAFVGSLTLAPGATVEDIAIVDVAGGVAANSSTASKLAYVAAGAAGFVIVDVSTPSAPSVAATQNTDVFASAVGVNGNDVYLGDGGSGFVTLAIDPTTVPVLFLSLVARPADRGVHLAWDFSADESVQGLEVFRSFGGNDLPVKVHRGLLPSSQREFRDEGLAAGKTYFYAVVAKTESGLDYLSPRVAVEMPEREAALFPNHPNPFNPSTTISFDLPGTGLATLAIYDVKGRHVVTLVSRVLPPGITSVEWDGTNASGERVSSGVYVAQLRSGNQVLTRKLTVLK